MSATPPQADIAPRDLADAIAALAGWSGDGDVAAAGAVHVALASPHAWPPFLPIGLGAAIVAHALGADVAMALSATRDGRQHDRAILSALRLGGLAGALTFTTPAVGQSLADEMIALAAQAQHRAAFVGVPHADLCEPMARALQRVGATRVALACGGDGLPGVTLDGVTEIATLRDGVVARETLDVFEEYEIEFCAPGMLRLPTPADPVAQPFGDPLEAASILGAVLQGAPGWPAQAVMLNAAVILELAGLTPGLGPGFREAGFALRDGRAYATWQRLRS